MKLILLIASTIAVLPVHSQPDESVNEAPQLKEVKRKSVLRHKGCGRPRLACALKGGHCVDKAEDCYGTKVFQGCKQGCHCCIPGCSKDLGFFSPPGSRQCFKLFEKGTWDDANRSCHEAELVMPHPYDAVSLRSYLVQKFGNAVVWLNGKMRGHTETVAMKWLDNEVDINNVNPLWRQSMPDPFEYSDNTDYCLQLRGDETSWDETGNYDKPYHKVPCSWDYYHALCELKLPGGC